MEEQTDVRTRDEDQEGEPKTFGTLGMADGSAGQGPEDDEQDPALDGVAAEGGVRKEAILTQDGPDELKPVETPRHTSTKVVHVDHAVAVGSEQRGMDAPLHEAGGKDRHLES